MADELQAAGLPPPDLGRRALSTRKRKAVDSYAPDSLEDILKPSPQPSRKRKRAAPPTDVQGKDESDDQPQLEAKTSIKSSHGKAINLHDDELEHIPNTKNRGKKNPTGGDSEEKRLKRFRKAMPRATEVVMDRAINQRMFVIDRQRHNNDDCPHPTADCPIEVVELAGSTGNIYTVTIGHVPTCSCPNFVKGNAQCKHILYVLCKVLKAPGILSYQLAFLTSELHDIFDNAGPIPTESAGAQDRDGKRKPVEGECPICVEELNAATEEIVWCHTACGNNLHKTCFDQWAASKRGGGKVTCPYCRSPWETSVDSKALKSATKTGAVGPDGYKNIASQLGISGRRDCSTYHSFWVRREHRAGNIDDEDAQPHYDYDY